MKGSKKNQQTKPLAASKPFVIPDRKQAQLVKSAPVAAATANDKPRKAYEKSNHKPIVSVSKKAWWEQQRVETDQITFAEGVPWYSLLPAYLDTVDPRSSGFDSHSVKLHGDRLASACKIIDVEYQKQMKAYFEELKTSSEKKSDLKWMNDMIKSGTMSDKVAAMALKVQGSPFHELETLDILIGLATKKEQRGAQLALEALKDLFVNNLLPGRALRSLENNALNHSNMNITTAMLIWFEAQLKSRYEKVLEALDNGLKSNVEFFKKECLQTVSELLIGRPEQEGRLLEMLVNKLGDPSRATCSKAIEVLKQVMKSHPAMKIIIVREVRQFLYRPNLKIRPIFNGIILLSQVQLAKGDHAVAVQLVEGYLSLFEKTMKEEEFGSRLLSALLTGINKALPYLQNAESLGKYVDPLFRIVHTATSFSTATQALMLLSHLALSAGSAERKAHGKSSEANVVEESQIVKRYYRALYAKLLSEQVDFIIFNCFILIIISRSWFFVLFYQITSRSKNTLFLNLLYRSIKGDPLHNRAMAFMKRLLMCATQSVPSIAAGLLFLISEILKVRPSLKACMADTPEAAHAQSGELDKDGEVGFLGNFNVLKREPEFAYTPDAQPSLWEMSLLQHHFHPSVQSFAVALQQEPEHHIEFGGDPTVEFSLMAFLNRFAYKNPKKNTSERIKHRTALVSEEPINLAFANQTAGSVDPDKQFFHKYFSDRQQLVAEGRSRNRSKQRADEDSAGSDDGDSDDDADPDGNGNIRAGNRSDLEDEDAEEAEMDRYADKLAEDLMRNGNSNIDNDDFEFSDEDDSDDGSAVAGLEDGEEGVEGGDDSSEEGREFDQGLVSGSSEDGDEEVPVKKCAKSKSNKALDFADFVAEQQQKGKKGAMKEKVTAKKAMKTEDDDSSDDGYTGLVAYGDDDNEMDAFAVADDDDDDDSDGMGGISDDDEDDDFSDEEAMDDETTSGKAKKGESQTAKEQAAAAAVGKKGRKGESAFASAEDYEDIMEEIVKAVSLPAPPASAPVAVAPASSKGRASVPVTTQPVGRGGKPRAVEATQGGVKRKGASSAVDTGKGKSSQGAGKKKFKSS